MRMTRMSMYKYRMTRFNGFLISQVILITIKGVIIMAISLSGLTSGLGDVYSNLLGGASSSTSSLFGSSTLLSDYASIKNGTYGKMLKQYYAKQKASLDEDSDTSSSSSKTKAGKDSASASAASSLNKSASALNNLNYNEENIDKIYDGVSAFVKDYNSMIKASSNSSVNSVNSQADTLNNYTYANYKMLVKAGITMNADRTLSLNEDTFKKADISTLKTLFKGTNSYADQVASKASKIYRYSNNGSSLANTYSSTGKYSTPDTSSMINSIL